MNALVYFARAAVVLLFIPLIWAVWAADHVREARLKRKLGADYEGPLED